MLIHQCLQILLIWTSWVIKKNECLSKQELLISSANILFKTQQKENRLGFIESEKMGRVNQSEGTPETRKAAPSQELASYRKASILAEFTGDPGQDVLRPVTG